MKTFENKVQAVFDILEDAHGQSPWTQEQIEKDMLLEQVDYYFVEKDQQIVGFLSLQDLMGELEITNIAVLKAYQGQGIASQLLDYLNDEDEPIFLEVRESNLKAQALYLKYDFKIVGKRKNYYQNPVEAALLMKREGNNEG